MDQVLRLNEFFVEGGKQGLSHVLLHITEPSTPEEARKGYFFALCEINNGDPIYITKLQDLIDRAENEYYELEEEEGRDVFEVVLEKMNGEAYVLEKVKDKLNCIVGAIRQKEIIFSYFGHPHLLLFYKNKQGLYEKMDLIKSNSNEEADENLFSQIVQGKLSANDYLFAGTPHITDFFSHDRLEKIITTRSAKQSADHIEKVLAELKNGFSFGGMIINLFQPEASEMVKKSPAVVQGSATGSLDSLFRREQSTADTLSPSILPRLDKIKTILKTPEKQLPGQKVRIDPLPAEISSAHVSHRQPRAPKEDLSLKMNIFFGRTWEVIKILLKYLASFFIVLYSIIYGFFKFIILLCIVLVNYQNRRTTIVEGWKMSWRGFKKNLVHLPLTTKILFFGSIIVAVGFVSSLFYLRYRQQAAAKEAAYNQTLNELRLKISSIDSGLIYKADNVIAEYSSAKELLAKLDCTGKEHKADCDNISNELNGLSTRIRKVTSVDPTVIADWTTLGGPKNLIRLKNKLVGYSPSTSTLFVFDLLSKKASVVPTYQTVTGFTEAAVPKENDYAIFLYNKKLLMQVEPNELAQKLIDISFSGNAELASMVLYNRRLYSVDSLNSTIYRHDSIKTGFGQGKDWSKTKADLKSATDMAVDGDMFVSNDSGQILKYTSGVATTFAISGLDPALSSGSKLWTYTDVPYLYILEPKEKRLVIVDKTNNLLVSQLTSPKFVNPTGLWVDYASKIAYIIDSGKLYSINLP